MCTCHVTALCLVHDHAGSSRDEILSWCQHCQLMNRPWINARVVYMQCDSKKWGLTESRFIEVNTNGTNCKRRLHACEFSSVYSNCKVLSDSYRRTSLWITWQDTSLLIQEDASTFLHSTMEHSGRSKFLNLSRVRVISVVMLSPYAWHGLDVASPYIKGLECMCSRLSCAVLSCH